MGTDRRIGRKFSETMGITTRLLREFLAGSTDSRLLIVGSGPRVAGEGRKRPDIT